MSTCFIALPVGQGDAFYLERGGIRVLIDGGRSVCRLAGILKTHANPKHLDVVVVTHNDADHANGIIGLLQKTKSKDPITIGEVWLPGSWAWRLQDLITGPSEFFDELYDNIRSERSSVSTMNEWYEKNSERLLQQTKELRSPNSAEHNGGVAEWLSDIISRAGTRKRPHEELQKEMVPLAGWRLRLWINCLKAAERIRTIAVLAGYNGARIRLFEFLRHPLKNSRSYKADLIPVNSREVRPPKIQIRVSALAYLALTNANRESLVFYAAEQKNNYPGVLFTADSDLAFGLRHVQPPATNLIVTAPHHGAEANSTAYAVVASWIEHVDNVIWVRSDCMCKRIRRPGMSFKQQPNRMCTICNPSSRPKAPVILYAVNAYWQPRTGIAWCSCR